MSDICYGDEPTVEVPYGTPTGNREVICIHCSDIYSESEVVFEQRFGYPISLWWCRNKECDGAGIMHDIYPTDEPFVAFAVWRTRWKAEHGFCPSAITDPIEQLARHFAPRKKLTLRRPLKKKRLQRFAAMKDGKL